MNSDTAATIAAVAFCVLVVALVVVLLKISRFIDSASATIRETGDALIPLLTELTETTQQANRQLAKIDVVETTTNLTSLISSFTNSIGGPLLRVGEIIRSVSGLIGKKKK
jgi:uncharacterized protein YoxC